MAKRHTHNLAAEIRLVKSLVAAIPAHSSADNTDYRAALADIRAQLQGRGARFEFVSGATLVVFAGVRASASAGEHRALEGWVRAAYRKLDRQAIARMDK